MKFVVVLLAFAVAVCNAVPAMNAANSDESRIWAVLVAGSRGWGNYRHQSDVCRAWHTLNERGVPENQTITFMYDDIASYSGNKFKGKIFNDYSHKDVYGGVAKDYTGSTVTPQNFMKVLTGQAPGVGSNKYLQSNENDRVFIYFNDHGGDGVLCFPDSDIYHDDLAKTLQEMYDKKMYGKLVFYIEACEAGSMFYDVKLPPNMYVVTASPIAASSWAWQYDSAVGTYLADVFAQAWVNQTENAPTDGFLFQEGYEYVTTHIDNGSQPCQYGDLSIAEEININDFFGSKKDNSAVRKTVGGKSFSAWKADASNGAVPNRMASLEAAKKRVAENPSAENIADLKYEQAVHQQVDNALHNILVAAGQTNGLSQVEPPCPTCSSSCKCLTGCGSSAECKFECCNVESCHKRYSLSKNGEECAKTLVRTWQKACGSSHDYIRTGDNVLSRACRLREGDNLNIDAAVQAIHDACPLNI